MNSVGKIPTEFVFIRHERNTIMKRILPIIIIVIGIIAAICACLLSCIVDRPTITSGSFDYSVTYKQNGEVKTLDGVYKCECIGISSGVDHYERTYSCYYFSEYSEENTYEHLIVKNGDLELYLIIRFSEGYLMADPLASYYTGSLKAPYFVVYDSEGEEYADEETIEKFGVEIVSWEYPEPIENTFVFGGFRDISANSMMTMLTIALLTVAACLVFVKKDTDVVYTSLDSISPILNAAVGLVSIPITVVVAWISPIYATGAELFYQVYLCIPAIIAFSIAASICLRRRGYTRTGFYMQFAGIALFTVLAVAESLPYYI